MSVGRLLSLKQRTLVNLVFCLQAGVSKLNEAKALVDELKRRAAEQSALLKTKQQEADSALQEITTSMQVCEFGCICMFVTVCMSSVCNFATQWQAGHASFKLYLSSSPLHSSALLSSFVHFEDTIYLFIQLVCAFFLYL